MTKPSIGVGIIGCGKIAQMMHLPFIHELPEFHIAALCDISRDMVDLAGDQYGVAARYQDHRDLLADPGVSAVVICNYDHGPVVADALAARKHLIAEKPLAFTVEEAVMLVEAANRADVVAMIGYMKFHDEGYQYARSQLARMGKPVSVTVCDRAGRMDIYNPLYTLSRASDVPADLLEASQKIVNEKVDASLGAAHAGHRGQYLNLLMLGSHDLAALRSMFGSPTGVDYAKAVSPTHVFSVLDYPDDLHVTLEIGFGARFTWWEEWIHVRTLTSDMLVEFAHPYRRYAPASVRTREAADGFTDERVATLVPKDAFRAQWQHFARCINDGEIPLTPFDGGLADLRLAKAIIQALPAT